MRPAPRDRRSENLLIDTSEKAPHESVKKTFSDRFPNVAVSISSFKRRHFDFMQI